MNLATLLIIGLVAVIVLQSSAVRWAKPTPVNLMIAQGDGGGGTARHVADTWQQWILTKADGSWDVRSSAVVGVNVEFELVDLNVIRSIEIEIPVQLATPLPSGNTGGFNWWTYVVVRPAVTVLINNVAVATADPNWFGARTFMTGDPAGSKVTYQFWVLLSGAMQRPSERTIDLRSEVSSRVASGSAKESD